MIMGRFDHNLPRVSLGILRTGSPPLFDFFKNAGQVLRLEPGNEAARRELEKLEVGTKNPEKPVGVV